MAQDYSFVVVKYADKDTGDAALSLVLQLAKQKVVELKDAVAITKTDEGKIKLHQAKDESIGKGLFRGGVIGVILAVVFGAAGAAVVGAAALGGVLGMFDKGIKTDLLKELGEDMTPDESALAVLIKEAHWSMLLDRFQKAGFGGKVVVSQLVAEDLAEVEQLADKPEVAALVPDEIEVPESS